MKSATKVLVSTFGTLIGLAGLEHGVGEILQGNVAPQGIMIQSWPDAAFFKVVAGEPAMTIIPNLPITGILACLFSLIFIGWSIWGVQRRQGGWIMICLSIAVLLFGGGIFPPIFGLIMAGIGMKIGTPLTWWRTHLSDRARSFLIKIWPWSLGICIAAWLGMVPGLEILEYYFGVENETLTLGLLGCMFGFLFLTSLAGFIRDSQAQDTKKSLSARTPKGSLQELHNF